MKLYSLAIHPAGWPFIGASFVVTCILGLLGWPFGLMGSIVTVWCVYFFRDPDRTTPARPGLIVSPADGKVIFVDEVVPEPELGLGDASRMRISIFLNVFDVHINRIPVDGTIVESDYRAGKFLHAASDKASVDNERMSLVARMEGDHPFAGQTIGFVQIAGFVARRIVCNVKDGDHVQAGERYGLIRFGSRADIYLPPAMQALVCVGQYMIGGETVLADAFSPEGARKGEVR
jgi:phosphatidylserine decarboxylase